MNIVNDDPGQISAMLAVIEGLVQADYGAMVLYAFDIGHPLDLPEPTEGEHYELIGQFTRVKHATHSVLFTAEENEGIIIEHELDVSKIQRILVM